MSRPQPPRPSEGGSSAEMLRGLAALAGVLIANGFPADISKAIQIGEALELKGFCIRQTL